MVIIDATFQPLGRFLVHDDLSIEEVLFLPFVSDEEVRNLEHNLHLKDSPFSTRLGVLLAAIATIYNVDPVASVIIHKLDEPPMEVEPEMD